MFKMISEIPYSSSSSSACPLSSVSDSQKCKFDFLRLVNAVRAKRKSFYEHDLMMLLNDGAAAVAVVIGWWPYSQ